MVAALLLAGALGAVVSGCGSSNSEANEQTPMSDNTPPPKDAYEKMVNGNPNLDPRVKKVLMHAGN